MHAVGGGGGADASPPILIQNVRVWDGTSESLFDVDVFLMLSMC
jgi:hypothetical protein